MMGGTLLTVSLVKAGALVTSFLCRPRQRELAPEHEPGSMHLLDLGEQQMEIARATASPRDAAFASWNLGLAYEELGHLAEAVALMQTCVDFERAVRHPHTERDATRVRAIQARLAGC